MASQTLTTLENSIATTISAINYGIVLCLSFACVRTLSQSKKYTVKKRRFFYSYIIAMLFFSTFALVLAIYMSPQIDPPETLQDKFSTDSRLRSGVSFSTLPPPDTTVDGVSDLLLSFLPFVIGLADSFMAWRCFVLYGVVSRVARIILLSVMGLFFLALLALLIISGEAGEFLANWALLIISISVGTNILLSALIVFRIRYHQSHIRRLLGTAHESTYNRIMVMCVESCGIIVVGEVLCLIPISQAESWVVYPLLCLPHICVISPLLIIYRVIAGIDVTTTLNVTGVIGDGGVEDIRFLSGHGVSTHHSEDGV